MCIICYMLVLHVYYMFCVCVRVQVCREVAAYQLQQMRAQLKKDKTLLAKAEVTSYNLYEVMSCAVMGM